MSNSQSFVLFGYTSSEDAVLEVKTLIHPQTVGKSSNYIYDQSQFLEIHKMDAYPSSWFVNDQVIQDGSITMATPIHPLFLCIPFLQLAHSSMFMQLEDLFVSRDYPDVACLASNPTVKDCIRLICDEKQSGEEHFYQFNNAKCVQWLQTRVKRVEEVLRKEWKAKEEEYLLEALRVMSRYIDDSLFTALCSAFQIKRSELVRAEVEQVKKQSEKRQESKPQRGKRAKLSESAKGTRSVASFFKHK